MPSVERLTPSGPLSILENGARLMQICNACRYCEGFCAVFPAMERRVAFGQRDLEYLANLCHDCGECFTSCQYAPPHEFDVNVPRTFAAIRRTTVERAAFPSAAGALVGRSRMALGVTAGVIPTIAVLALWLFGDAATVLAPHADADGAFYAVLPHTLMVGLFSSVGVLVLLLLAAGTGPILASDRRADA